MLAGPKACTTSESKTLQYSVRCILNRGRDRYSRRQLRRADSIPEGISYGL